MQKPRYVKRIALGSVLILMLLFGLVLARLIFAERDFVLNHDAESLANDAKNLTHLRNPTLLHHGMLPFISLHRMARELRAEGYPVYSTQVPSTNTIQVRAKEFLRQVDWLHRHSGHKKINVIAHSMGGIDARYAISQLGAAERIASLTTLGTPHHGSSLAQFLLDAPGASIWAMFSDFTVGLFVPGSLWPNTDLRACLQQLTPNYMEKIFNPQNPDVPGVYYQSWAGKNGPPGVGNEDYVYFISTRLAQRMEGDNDGIVGIASAQWGHFRGVVDAGHSAMIGRYRLGSSHFAALDFFRMILEDLAKRGF